MEEQNKDYIKLVVYKRIVEGDLRKFSATSNITPSGGGARDLRFSPDSEFLPIFQRMFPKTVNGCYCGHFYWEKYEPTEVEIAPPTNSRPHEVRITKIHECFPQEIIPNDSTDCVLLILLKNDGTAWPYFTSLVSLKNDDEWDPEFKDAIIEGLLAKRNANVTAMGYIDYENKRRYTNGSK